MTSGRPDLPGADNYEVSLIRILDGIADELGWELQVFPLVQVSDKQLQGNLWADRIAPLLRPQKSKTSPLQTLISRIREFSPHLVYHSSPNASVEALTEFPFILTVWDLGHRDLPEFPEFRAREWPTRERMFRDCSPRAFHIMTDSRVTAHKLSEFYGVQPKKVSNLGLLFDSEEYLRANPVEPLSIDTPYFIYPAGRWPHKNHHVVFRAIDILRGSFPQIQLVLTGAGQKLERMIEELDLQKNILDLGLVSKSKLRTLIENSHGLLMPSLLGPTNLPPLEALSMGVPAIVSAVHEYDGRADSLIVKVEDDNPLSWSNAISRFLPEKVRNPPEKFETLEATREIRKVLLHLDALQETWRLMK